METPPLQVGNVLFADGNASFTAGGTCSLRMETPPLRLGTCLLRMETPLRGRSGGHTGAAPTISPMARVIRLPEEAPPMDKHDGIVAARCFPLH